MTKKIAIIGGGISGLGAAWYLKKKFGTQVALTLYEKTGRVGGWIRSFQEQGFLFEQGPRGFRPKGKGETTLELVKELGLERELVAADKQSKVRYICVEEALYPFNFRFLLCRGLVGALWRDLRCKRSPIEDESMANFFRRHLNRKITDVVIDPLAKGVFGGNAETLSVRACFPKLWEIDQRKGSLIRGFIGKSKKQKRPPTPLYSFKKGMETLPKTLAEKLDAKLELMHPLDSLDEIEADCVISALPGYALAPLLGIEDPISYNTLSTVSFGWNGELLKKRGYGFLVPTAEKEPFLGMTWDSEIFPEQNQGSQTRICVMIGGEHDEEELITLAMGSVKKYLDIETSPDALLVRSAKKALPQYLVGHHERVAFYEQSLPQHWHLLGNTFYGMGVNDCLHKAKMLCESLSF